MNRRVFLSSSALAIVIPSALGAATKVTYTISSVSVSGPFAQGTKDIHNAKGTMSFRKNSSSLSLTAYWNGNAVKDLTRQCPELPKRYAKVLGFAGYASVPISGDNGNNLPSLGNGDQVASRFASASGGGFNYRSSGSSEFPKDGAVVSIFGTSTTGVLVISGGHCGILFKVSIAKNGATGSAMLFDENNPVATWKSIRFEKRGNGWYGYWPNSGREHSVIGWANPNA